MDIYNTVNGVDMKLWNNSLMKLYENHVKSENTLKKPTHDPKGLEEMKTHVKHLEKSIHQINKSSEKIIMRREHEVYQKLKENADLIYDLNEMRKLNKELMTDQQNKKREIENL
jgi:cilia- and flagella-associated protein 57